VAKSGKGPASLPTLLLELSANTSLVWGSVTAISRMAFALVSRSSRSLVRFGSRSASRSDFVRCSLTVCATSLLATCFSVSALARVASNCCCMLLTRLTVEMATTMTTANNTFQIVSLYCRFMTLR
jgi:hypothetical protein